MPIAVRVEARRWNHTTRPSASRRVGPVRCPGFARGVTKMKPGAFAGSLIVVQTRGIARPGTEWTRLFQGVAASAAAAPSASAATAAASPSAVRIPLVRRRRLVAAGVLAPHRTGRADHATLLVQGLDLHDRARAADRPRGLEAAAGDALYDHLQLAARGAGPDAPGGDLGCAVPAGVHARGLARRTRGNRRLAAGMADPGVAVGAVGLVLVGIADRQQQLAGLRELRVERLLAPPEEGVPARQHPHVALGAGDQC